MSKRSGLFIMMIFVILGGLFSLRSLEFATDIGELQFANSTDLNHYKEVSASFPAQAEGVIIILEKEDGFNTINDFKWVDTFTDQISDYEEIEAVSSITTLQLPRKGFLGPLYKPFIDLESEEGFSAWLLHYKAYEDINQKFISADRKYLLCYLTSKTGLSATHLQNIAALDTQTTAINISVVQRNLNDAELKREWINETFLIAVICIGLILITFYYFTHAIKALGIILFMILFNVSATVIFMVVMGIAFNIQMVALPCLVILFSFSDILHILYHHSSYIREGFSKNQLQKKLISTLRVALFFTSFSNLFGFLIFFYLSENQVLEELALVAIFAVTISYLSGRYLVIWMLNIKTTYISLAKIKSIQESINQIINRIKLNKWISFYSLIAVMLLIAVLVKSEFKIDTQKNALNSSNPTLNHSREVLANEFYGSKSIEIFINYPDTNVIWDLEWLRMIEKLEGEITHHFEPHYIVSPVTIVKRYNRYLVNGNPAAFKLPPLISSKTRKNLNNNYVLLGGDQVISPSMSRARILFGHDDQGLYESLVTYSKIQSILHDAHYSRLNLELSGVSYLADRGTERFTENLITAWLIAALLSSLFISIYLKSILKGMVVLLVNVLPVLLIVYLMPYFGLNINPQSLFLLTILAGLCVDDSIYLMLNRVHKKSDLSYFPIIVTSVVLAAGFLAFAFSAYTWLSPFAWLFVIGIVVALALDLFILPLFMFKSDDERV